MVHLDVSCMRSPNSEAWLSPAGKNRVWGRKSSIQHSAGAIMWAEQKNTIWRRAVGEMKAAEFIRQGWKLLKCVLILADSFYSWFHHKLSLVFIGHCSKTSATDFVKYIQIFWCLRRWWWWNWVPRKQDPLKSLSWLVYEVESHGSIQYITTFYLSKPWIIYSLCVCAHCWAVGAKAANCKQIQACWYEFAHLDVEHCESRGDGCDRDNDRQR